MRLWWMVLALLLAFAPAALRAGPYEDGVDAAKAGDYPAAVRHFRVAAELGSPDAQNDLGAMYANGRGVPQHYAEAVRWYRKAAERGHVNAQTNLGLMYAEGRGVPQDYLAALRWWRKAAEKGFADAQYNLGAMYANGLGVQRDFVQTHMWWTLAAAQGQTEAAKYREVLASQMSPAQIAEAQGLAREWKPKGK